MLLPEKIISKNQSLFLITFMLIGLSMEKLIPLLWGQIICSVLAWGIFLTIYYRQNTTTAKIILMSCLLIATLGELFCSLMWGLYDYRLGNIPHYVPPGHVFLFLIGVTSAPRLPHWIVYFVPLLAAPYVLSGYYLGFDEFGVILFAFFIACLINGPDRRLYATMFILALCLEIYGTHLGNWTWRAEVPYWGISNINPPLASGAFYCLLDFLVLHFIPLDGK